MQPILSVILPQTGTAVPPVEPDLTKSAALFEALEHGVSHGGTQTKAESFSDFFNHEEPAKTAKDSTPTTAPDKPHSSVDAEPEEGEVRPEGEVEDLLLAQDDVQLGAKPTKAALAVTVSETRSSGRPVDIVHAHSSVPPAPEKGNAPAPVLHPFQLPETAPQNQPAVNQPAPSFSKTAEPADRPEIPATILHIEGTKRSAVIPSHPTEVRVDMTDRPIIAPSERVPTTPAQQMEQRTDIPTTVRSVPAVPQAADTPIPKAISYAPREVEVKPSEISRIPDATPNIGMSKQMSVVPTRVLTTAETDVRHQDAQAFAPGSLQSNSEPKPRQSAQPTLIPAADLHPDNAARPQLREVAVLGRALQETQKPTESQPDAIRTAPSISIPSPAKPTNEHTALPSLQPSREEAAVQQPTPQKRADPNQAAAAAIPTRDVKTIQGILAKPVTALPHKQERELQIQQGIKRPTSASTTTVAYPSSAPVTNKTITAINTKIAPALSPLASKTTAQQLTAEVSEPFGLARADTPATTPIQTTTAPPQPLAAHVIRQIADVAHHLPNRPVDITLNPEELGRVRLSMAPVDAGIVVSVLADRPETLDLLRRHIADLGQEIQSLGYDDVSFSFAGGDSQDPDQRSAENLHADPITPAETDMAATHILTQITTDSGLDLRL